MNICVLDKGTDKRTGCISVLTRVKLSDYLTLISKAFKNNGNINGQRGVIKRSSSATKIRDRMNKDFIEGAIFPPVVLGLLSDDKKFKNLEFTEVYKPDFAVKLIENLKANDYEGISIIDGVQRSNIYANNSKCNEDREIRVEIWIASNLTKLLYRMLVLNTGQVPWNLRRQVEVVYKPFLSSLENRLFSTYPDLKDKVKLYDINDNGRRNNAGEYHRNQLVELYLAFNLRNEKVDVETQLAEDFHRLDMVEALEKEQNFNIFVDIFANLCKLDISLGGINDNLSEVEGKFTDGKSLFTSHPARVGFVVAATQQILGKIKRDKSQESAKFAYTIFEDNCNKFINRVEKLKTNKNELIDFFSFNFLNEYINTLPKSKVGDVERKGFKNSFYELLKEEGELLSLEPYWREF